MFKFGDVLRVGKLLYLPLIPPRSAHLEILMAYPKAMTSYMNPTLIQPKARQVSSYENKLHAQSANQKCHPDLT